MCLGERISVFGVFPHGLEVCVERNASALLPQGNGTSCSWHPVRESLLYGEGEGATWGRCLCLCGCLLLLVPLGMCVAFTALGFIGKWEYLYSWKYKESFKMLFIKYLTANVLLHLCCMKRWVWTCSKWTWKREQGELRLVADSELLCNLWQIPVPFITVVSYF